MPTKRATIRVQPLKMSLTAPIYEKDFYKWTETQANLLKKGEFDKLDKEHLIEEIISLGRSERDKLESFLTLLLMHMLKVEYQPAKHTKSWDLSIKNAKHKAKLVIKENPSLKHRLPQLLKEAYFSARLEAAIETGLEEKTFPKDCPWSLEMILT